MTEQHAIRYGVIGTGAMGQEHIRYLNLIDQAKVTAVVDTDSGMRASASALAPDAICSSNLKQVIDQNIVDAWILATPNHTHIKIMPMLLDTDLPILLEKPVCTTVSDCEHLVSLAKASKSMVWVAMEYRYMSPIASLIKRVHEGDTGTLKMLTIREHRMPFLVKVDNWNRFNINSGGTLVEKCCHFFDLMRLIVQSEPVLIYASGDQAFNHLDETYDGQTPDILDNAFVTVDFANGVRATLELCMFAEGNYFQESVTAIGNIATLTANIPRAMQFEKQNVQRDANLTLADRGTGLQTTETFQLDLKMLEAGAHFGSTYHEHMKFIQAIRNNSNPHITLQDGLRAVQMGAAAQQSAKSRQAISIDFFNSTS